MRISLIAATLIATAATACTSQEPAQGSETATTAQADVPTITDGNKGPIFTGPSGAGNVAVSGYDAVSYFEGDGVPVKGSADHRVNYNGAEYHFASAESAAKFQAGPAKFAPKYGGHCAWAMSRGKLASGDPLQYRIVDGALYINFSADVQKMWLEDVPGFIEKAEAKWPDIPTDARFDDA